VRRTFRALAESEPDRYLVLDATGGPDQLAAAIRARVGELLAGLPSLTRPEDDRPARDREAGVASQLHR
jgi:dTMP kinase